MLACEKLAFPKGDPPFTARPPRGADLSPDRRIFPLLADSSRLRMTAFDPKQSRLGGLLDWLGVGQVGSHRSGQQVDEVIQW